MKTGGVSAKLEELCSFEKLPALNRSLRCSWVIVESCSAVRLFMKVSSNAS